MNKAKFARNFGLLAALYLLGIAMVTAGCSDLAGLDMSSDSSADGQKLDSTDEQQGEGGNHTGGSCPDDSGKSEAGGTGGKETGGTGGEKAGGSGGEETGGSEAGGTGGEETGGTGGEEAGGNGGVGGSGGNELGGAGGTGGELGCNEDVGSDDFERKIVVAHTLNNEGKPFNKYEVFHWAVDGTIGRSGVTFEMGTAQDEIIFTPNGKIGLVIQDQAKNRSIGVFRLEKDGSIHVIDKAFKVKKGYPSRIVMHPSGNFAYLLDTNWVENGGGIYRLDIDCDGNVTDKGKLFDAKLPRFMNYRGDNKWLVVSKDVLGSDENELIHLIRMTTPPTRSASSKVFADDAAIASSLTVTADGKFGLVTNNAMFSTTHTLGVVAIDDDALHLRQEVGPIDDALSVQVSPFGKKAIVISGHPSALHELDYDPDIAEPFSLKGKLTCPGPKMQLPGMSIMITRGKLKGRVLINDLRGLRQVAFSDTKGVECLEHFTTGDTLSDSVGYLGVQR